MATLALIKHDEHTQFLTHDSYVACNYVSHEYRAEKLMELFDRDPGILIGSLSQTARESVSQALDGNALIRRRHLLHIRPFWP